jgi:hypothetical protein
VGIHHFFEELVTEYRIGTLEGLAGFRGKTAWISTNTELAYPPFLQLPLHRHRCPIRKVPQTPVVL